MTKNMGLGLRLRGRGNSFILPPGTILGGGYFDDTDTFYSHTIGQAQTIGASYFNTEADVFYGATVLTTQFITGGFFNTESDSFYNATVALVAGPQNIAGGFFNSETDSFYTATILVTQFITASYFNSETDSFYASTVAIVGGTIGTPSMDWATASNDNTPAFDFFLDTPVNGDTVDLHWTNNAGTTGSTSGTYSSGAITGMTLPTLADGTWDAYCVHNRTGWTSGTSAVVTKVIDVTAPTLSGVSGTGGVLSATLNWSTNEGNGFAAWVWTTSSTVPSVAQVEAGQDNTGAAAMASGSLTVTASGAQPGIASGALTAGTRYGYIVQEDIYGNPSTVYSTGAVTVSSSFTPSVDFSDSRNSQYVGAIL